MDVKNQKRCVNIKTNIIIRLKVFKYFFYKCLTYKSMTTISNALMGILFLQAQNGFSLCATQ
jgi:hypothetical protein